MTPNVKATGKLLGLLPELWLAIGVELQNRLAFPLPLPFLACTTFECPVTGAAGHPKAADITCPRGRSSTGTIHCVRPEVLKNIATNQPRGSLYE